MSAERGAGSPLHQDPRETPRFTELFQRYVEELQDRGFIDPDAIVEAHPDIGLALVEDLETYIQLRPLEEQEASEPLGTLGDYTLRRQLGRGGMGVVYEAWQSSMDRVVALKVLPPGVAADEKAFTRFMREAKTAGKLAHQNIVSVHAAGFDENTPYYAMELVEGETLAQVLAKIKEAEPETETPFGAKDEVAYFHNLAKAFADVADGLQHAHSKGVTHRDIKPSNLILDADGRLRILDFGLARLEGQESLTLSGDFIGTPLYMSPEQARRKKIPVDHRTDVYSLGATMYEAICGRPPFRGKDHADTLSQIIERDPVEPRKVNLRVPKDLETIVLKCLRKDSGDRYRTAEALGQDLRRFVRGDGIEAQAEARWDRVRRWLRRHRGRLAAAAAVLVLLSVVAWLAYRREQERRIARLAEYAPAVRVLRERLERGEFSLHSFAGESVAGVSLVLPVAQGYVTSRIRLEDLTRLRESRGLLPFGDAAENLAVLARSVPKPDAPYILARACLSLERSEDARSWIRRALSYDQDFVPAQVLAGSDRLEELRSSYAESDCWQRWWLEAYIGMQKKKWKQAIKAYDRLLALRTTKGEPYVGIYCEAYLRRGFAHLKELNYRQAAEDFVAAELQTPGLEPTLLLAKAYYLGGKSEWAAQNLEQLYSQAADNERAELALWIAALYDSLNNCEAALEWVRRVTDVSVQARISASLLTRLGRTEAAIDEGRRSIAVDPEAPLAYLTLASALLRDVWLRLGNDPRGRLAELRAVARKAADLKPDNKLAQLFLEAAEAENGAEATSLTATAGRDATAQTLGGFFTDVRAVEQVNSHPWWEGTPSTSHDGTTLYLDSRRPGGLGGTGPTGRDLMLALRQADGRFGEAEFLVGLNSEQLDTGFVVSSDGNEGYFTSGRSGNNELYTARLESGGWTDIRPLHEINDFGHYSFHAKIDCDARTIVWMSNRPGRAGGDGSDIWMATRDDKYSLWGAVRNLDEVNTLGAGNPSLSCDALALFFQRDFDIWVATRGSRSERFSTQVRLGTAVNSPFFDGHPFIAPNWPASGSKLYFARCMNQACDLDIFEATWVSDCNGNGIDDLVDIASGDAGDENANGVPDLCEDDGTSAVPPRRG